MIFVSVGKDEKNFNHLRQSLCPNFENKPADHKLAEENQQRKQSNRHKKIKHSQSQAWNIKCANPLSNTHYISQ